MITRSLTAATLALGLLALPAGADEDSGLADFQSLKPDLAIELAQATLEACRAEGYQVAVVVVDRFGQAQVTIRDRFAGAHTIPTANGKAWTAVSFRAPTLELDERISAGDLSAGLRDIPGALFLGGGMPVEAAGSIVAGIGVSGAPDPSFDEDCAVVGIDAISDRIAF